MTRTLPVALAAVLFASAPAAADDTGGLPAWAQPSAPAAAPAAPMPPNPGTGDPGGTPAIPIDGGLSLLAAAGAGYAVNRLRKRRSVSENL